MSTKILEKRGVSGAMELLYIWEEVQSGFQPEYVTTVTLEVADENHVAMREESKVKDYSPSGHGSQGGSVYEIGVEELMEFIKTNGNKVR